MPTTEQYLNDLIEQKNALAETLATAGVEVGENETFSTLVPKAKEKIEAGGDGFYDALWDVYQQNGERTDYKNAFSSKGWTDDIFNPKYPIRPIVATSMFSGNGGLTNLDGIDIDFSQANNASNCFADSEFVRLPFIDMSRCHAGEWGCANLFNGAKKLETVEKLIIRKDGNSSWTGTFTNCVSLKNIKLEGVVIKTIKFSDSPLALESAIGFINALKDYSGTDKEYVYSLTFSATTKTLLETEGATAPNGKTWLEYADSKGWNI